ncbi:MAG: amylosucrase, partial [Fusobacteriota bacterium]
MESLLNEIVKKLDKNEVKDLNIFWTRLGKNFKNIYEKFQHLYGQREDFGKSLENLIAKMMKMYIQRPDELKDLDFERLKNPLWYQDNRWVGTMLYVDRYSDNLNGFEKKVDYLQDLGINYVHLMPILKSPEGENDGGYAVSNYKKVDEKFGTMEDINKLSKKFKKNNMLLELDFVLNHTSDEHEWAKRALNGEKKYQDYYYMYDSREIPDKFEETLPEVFPDNAPGNFTYREEINKWIFTVFNNYQWDLNYTNPEVFIEIMDRLLYLANQGIDILRLDAVAFMWKRIGTDSQNEMEVHLLLQLMKACAEIVAPATIFKAEAIVQPNEIVKYLGQGSEDKECEIAYNASYMVFLWDALATKNTKLMIKGLENMPRIPKNTTWINYARCHDDIGLGFSDLDAMQVGYDPKKHRDFLIEYYVGEFPNSLATGERFMYNPKTGDSRISGSMASLVGLEKAVEIGNSDEIQKAINKIILLHSAIISFGGIPIIYAGDEIGTINDYSYKEDREKTDDNRWMHRPIMDWDKAQKRKKEGTIENKIFTEIKKLIDIKKDLKEFDGVNDYQLYNVDNSGIFSFLRKRDEEKTLVLMNFSDNMEYINKDLLKRVGFNEDEIYDATGKNIKRDDQNLILD